ncbi:drebrin-like protein [Nilaparvata lugens]|uniref:drebrin-like protein n=1 Tax=Nilaparvata lugens TaxID=108931 RepID=UPI00193D8FD6|nr:drebrin-like protein [Nilaparvata lugens]
MAINLVKNKDALIAAWKDVVDDKSQTDWALFGYEGQSNDLKVVSKGDGGIDEMKEDLNSGKIMYAFCKVLDPKTSLNKFVLINWQGEGAPNLRKGTCANHIRDVTNLFKGAHLTINARIEDEVEQDTIIDKVSKCTGSAYSFKQRSETNPKEERTGPVGTTYQRVIPMKEINTSERDEFWRKEEEEEKKRQEEERKRKAEERLRIEEELQEKKRQEEERKRKAEERLRIEEELRKREEAQELISKRTIDARAVFEQNTSAGQMLQKRPSFPGSASNNGLSNSVADEAAEPNSITCNVPKEEEKAKAEETPPHPPNNEPPALVKEESLPSQIENLNISNCKEEAARPISSIELAQPYVDPLFTNGDNLLVGDDDDLGLRAEALYDYQAADSTEISFDPGDIITHIDQIDAGWWQGVGPDGSFGLFPANYVQLLD